MRTPSKKCRISFSVQVAALIRAIGTQTVQRVPMAAATVTHDAVDVTSEEEGVVMPISRWRALLAGTLCALFVGVYAIGAAKRENLAVPQGEQHKAWEQGAMQKWAGPGLAHPEELDEIDPADWNVDDVRTLYPVTGTARVTAEQEDQFEEVHGIIQKWSEEIADDKVMKALNYHSFSASKPKGHLDHFQFLWTHDWAAQYWYSDKTQDAPLGCLLDSLLMHRHYKDKLDHLQLPSRKKAYYVIKPRSEFHKTAQKLFNTADKAATQDEAAKQ